MASKKAKKVVTDTKVKKTKKATENGFISKTDYTSKVKGLNFGRRISSATKYKVWIEANGKCSFCGDDLLFLNESSPEKTGKRNHGGQLAHIISASNKKIRPSTVYSQVVNSIFNIKGSELPVDCNGYNGAEITNDNFYFNDSNKKIPEGYSADVLQNEQNLILSCFSCHAQFDNKKPSGGGKNIEFINKVTNSMISSEDKLKMCFAFKKEIRERVDHTNIKFTAIDEASLESTLAMIISVEESLQIRFSYKSLVFNEDGVFKLISDFETKNLTSDNLNDFIKQLAPLMKADEKQAVNVGIEVVKSSPVGDYILFEIYEHDEFDLLKEHKDREFLKDLLDNEIKTDKELSNVSFNVNNSNSDLAKFKDKPDYVIMKKTLLQLLSNYASSERSEFTSASIAYMARWGTGKTTLIRTIAEELSDYFNYVEINLWNIANSLPEKMHETDNTFVRQIVKESITQLLNKPELVSNFVDSAKMSTQTSRETELKESMLSTILKMPTKSNEISVFQERSKFLDQFITTLSEVINTIFKFTQKPTIFVFDDLDRVNDSEKVIQILDAIVAFLNLKNSVYVIPVDESKVMKAITEIKPEQDPYQYINKYFTYSVRPPFIPKMDTYTIFLQTIKEVVGSDEKINEQLLRAISALIDPTYRSVKDFINVLFFNRYTLGKVNKISNGTNDKTYFEDLSEKVIKPLSVRFPSFVHVGDVKEYFTALGSIIQMRFPLLVDFFSKDIDNTRFFAIELGKENNVVDKFLTFMNSSKDTPFSANSEREIELLESILTYRLDIKPKQDAKSFKEVIGVVDKDDAKKLIAIKKRFEANLKYINTLSTSFKVSNMSNDYVICIWLATTLADIKNDKAKLFLELSYIFEKVKSNPADFKQFIEEKSGQIDIDKNIIILFDEFINFDEMRLASIDDLNDILRNFSDQEYLQQMKIIDSANGNKISSNTYLANFAISGLWQSGYRRGIENSLNFFNKTDVISLLTRAPEFKITSLDLATLANKVEDDKAVEILISKHIDLNNTAQKQSKEKIVKELSISSVRKLVETNNYEFAFAPSISTEEDSKFLMENSKIFDSHNQLVEKIIDANKFNVFDISDYIHDEEDLHKHIQAISQLINENNASSLIDQLVSVSLETIEKHESKQLLSSILLGLIKNADDKFSDDNLVNIFDAIASEVFTNDEGEVSNYIDYLSEEISKTTVERFLKLEFNRVFDIFDLMSEKEFLSETSAFKQIYLSYTKEISLEGADLSKWYELINTLDEEFDDRYLSNSIMNNKGFIEELSYIGMPYMIGMKIDEIIENEASHNNQIDNGIYLDVLKEYFDRENDSRDYFEELGFKATKDFFLPLLVINKLDLRLFSTDDESKNFEEEFEKYIESLSYDELSKTVKPINADSLNILEATLVRAQNNFNAISALGYPINGGVTVNTLADKLSQNKDDFDARKEDLKIWNEAKYSSASTLLEIVEFEEEVKNQRRTANSDLSKLAEKLSALNKDCKEYGIDGLDAQIQGITSLPISYIQYIDKVKEAEVCLSEYQADLNVKIEEYRDMIINIKSEIKRLESTLLSKKIKIPQYSESKSPNLKQVYESLALRKMTLEKAINEIK